MKNKAERQRTVLDYRQLEKEGVNFQLQCMGLEDILDQRHAQPHSYKRHYGRIEDIKMQLSIS